MHVAVETGRPRGGYAQDARLGSLSVLWLLALVDQYVARSRDSHGHARDGDPAVGTAERCRVLGRGAVPLGQLVQQRV